MVPSARLCNIFPSSSSLSSFPPSSDPAGEAGFSGSSSSTELLLLLEMDSASDSQSTSGPESPAEELDSPSPPYMKFFLWL